MSSRLHPWLGPCIIVKTANADAPITEKIIDEFFISAFLPKIVGQL